MDLFTFEDFLVVFLKFKVNKTICLSVCLSVRSELMNRVMD